MIPLAIGHNATGIVFLSNESLNTVEGNPMDEATLVLYVILYVLLPLWGLASMLDWWCHKKTSIESTSGLHEANIHCLMGFQIAIPLVFGTGWMSNESMFLMEWLLVLACGFIPLLSRNSIASFYRLVLQWVTVSQITCSAQCIVNSASITIVLISILEKR